MHRTQVYLDSHQYQALRVRARREGKTLAAIIRGILDAHFQGQTKGAPRDPFHRVIGICRGDGSAVAENYEDYLYGDRA